MADAQLTLSSRNYSSWSLRGWLLCRLAGLAVSEKMIALDDPDNRAELLLLSPSVLVPRLTHEGASVWDTLAIAEYLHELYPQAGMYPADRIARAHCRSVSGEIHSGFANLRSALPMNLKVRHDRFPVFPGARPAIERVETIWSPVVQRFLTYAVAVSPTSAAYCETVNSWPLMREWINAARREPDEMIELETEF